MSYSPTRLFEANVRSQRNSRYSIKKLGVLACGSRPEAPSRLSCYTEWGDEGVARQSVLTHPSRWRMLGGERRNSLSLVAKGVDPQAEKRRDRDESTANAFRDRKTLLREEN